MVQNAKFVISSENRASKAIRQVQNDIKKMSDKVRQWSQSLSSFSQKWISSIKKMTTEIDKFARKHEKTFRDMRNYGVWTFVAITASATHFAKKAMEFEEVEWAFWRMTESIWADWDKIIKSLTEASRWAVSQYDLMLSANKAMSLWVAKNSDEFTTLMDIARVKAKTMWLTTTQAFDDIVTWLWRASPLILDNLWISVKLWEAQERYAQKLWKTVNELTEAEKKQALVNSVVTDWKKELEAMWEVTETTREKVWKVTAWFQNLKQSIGETFLWEEFWGSIDKVSNFINKIENRVENNKSLTKWLIVWAWAVAWFIAVLWTAWLVIPKVIAWVQSLWTILTAMSGPIWFVVLAIAGLYAARTNNIFWIQEKTQQFFADAKRIWQDLSYVTSTTFKAIWWFFSQLGNDFTRIRKTLQARNESVKQLFNDLISNALNRWKNMIQQLVDWIKSWIGAVGDAVKQVANKIKAFLWFSSPTEEWPWANADKRMPNLVKMLSAWLIAWAPIVASASWQVASWIESWLWQAVESSVWQQIEDKTHQTQSIIERFWKKTWEVYLQMQWDFESRKTQTIETLQSVDNELKEKTQSITQKAKELAQEFSKLRWSFAGETQSENQQLAQKIVDQKNKIISIEQQIADKRWEIQKWASWERVSQLNRELATLQDQLQKEKEAYQQAHQYRISLSNEIVEVERRNRLTDFERYLEDWQARQNKRVEEFEQKKELMQQEAIDLVKQQKAITEIRRVTNNTIVSIVQSTTQKYKELVSQQANVTKTETDRMKQYYDWVTAKINNMIQSLQRARSMSFGWWFAWWIANYRADWWIIGWPWVYKPMPIQKFQTWWVVKWPLGEDRVPTMLTAWELVLNRAQQQSLARQLNWWTTIIIQWNTYYWMPKNIVEEMLNDFTKGLSRNTKIERI